MAVRSAAWCVVLLLCLSMALALVVLVRRFQGSMPRPAEWLAIAISVHTTAAGLPQVDDFVGPILQGIDPSGDFGVRLEDCRIGDDPVLHGLTVLLFLSRKISAASVLLLCGLAFLLLWLPLPSWNSSSMTGFRPVRFLGEGWSFWLALRLASGHCPSTSDSALLPAGRGNASGVAGLCTPTLVLDGVAGDGYFRASRPVAWSRGTTLARTSNRLTVGSPSGSSRPSLGLRRPWAAPGSVPWRSQRGLRPQLDFFVLVLVLALVVVLSGALDDEGEDDDEDEGERRGNRRGRTGCQPLAVQGVLPTHSPAAAGRLVNAGRGKRIDHGCHIVQAQVAHHRQPEDLLVQLLLSGVDDKTGAAQAIVQRLESQTRREPERRQAGRKPPSSGSSRTKPLECRPSRNLWDRQRYSARRACQPPCSSNSRSALRRA